MAQDAQGAIILQSLKGGAGDGQGAISSRAKREQRYAWERERERGSSQCNFLFVLVKFHPTHCSLCRALAKQDEKKRERDHSLKLEAMDILEEESRAEPVSEFIDLGMRVL
jgi:hypothetical protein